MKKSASFTNFARLVCGLLLGSIWISQSALCSLAQEAGARQNLATEKKTEPREPEASTPLALFSYRHFDSWAGQRFIFLSGPKASENAIYDDFSGKITRKKYAGRIATVVSASDFNGRIHVEFEMEDTHERIRASTLPHKESVMGIAPLEDIQNARQQWRGKTLWSRESRLSTYDEQTDIVSLTIIKKYSPVKVLDVVAGWSEEKPVRFVLEAADGKHGFLDLNLSGTNVFKDIRHLSRFEHCFVTEDPRVVNKWSPQIWSLIENGQIGAGLTAEQVKMSWGQPDKVTRTATGENWIYQVGTLVFKNGILSGMQN